MEQNYDHELAVFIGRFQPLHEGHMSVIKQALVHAPHVAVIIGSAGTPRSHRNPFTYEERASITKASAEEAGIDPASVICLPLEDSVYNDGQWMTNVRKLVSDSMVAKYGRTTGNISLIGHSKDHTSFYLDMFPEWSAINVPNYMDLSATPLRQSYFSNIGHMWLNDIDGHKDGDSPQERKVTSAVRKFLMGFLDTPTYKAIRAEYEFITNYRQSYVSLPFPPVFVTADACVIQSGHILLVRRKDHPGKGQWALPGGYVKEHQTVLQAMLAELTEETTIGIDAQTITGSIIYKGEYDDPHRDPRGRVITHAFLVHLKRNHTLPTIQGADDAEEARWWPLTEVRRDMMFIDHMDIITNLVTRI